MATIHFKQEVPSLGDKITVWESAVEIASKMRAAGRGNPEPMIRLHYGPSRVVTTIPVDLIGPVID